MIRYALAAAGLLMVSLLLTACKPNKPKYANGDTVLTMAQYEQLTAKMQANPEIAAVGKSESAAIDGDTFAVGAAHYQNRDYFGAAREFEKITNDNSADGKVWYMLGSCYEHLGDIGRAQTAFKKSYDIMVAQGFIADTSQLR